MKKFQPKKLSLALGAILMGGCLFAQTTHRVTLNSLQPDVLMADAGADWDSTFIPTPLVLGGNPTATGGTPPYLYQWSPATDLDSDTISNPTLLSINFGQRTYVLEVTDARNCLAIDSLMIRLRFIGTEDWLNPHFEVFPNPASQFLTIKTPRSAGRLLLTDLHGRVIQEVHITESEVHLAVAALSRGSYILQYTYQNQVFSQKITLQ
jgi:hypothetical protein